MYCSGAIKSSEFGEWGKRHNGDHVIHVTRWWRHGKQRRIDGRSFRCRWRSGREVSDRVWINPDPEGYFQWICSFWIPSGKVGSYLVCKVSLVVRSWLITPRHAKLCELAGKWPVAILTGHWIRRTEPWSGRYILNWSQFHDARVIACTSLLIYLSGKLHGSIFRLLCFLNWLWFYGSRFRNGSFASKFPKMKIVFLAIGT